ncbi:hypothetical protein MoryE10_09550 [Methylogaea oryzae]|uniref:Mor transcription activator domain-containing protein n=1 Tax=Methylogaea oryzae TaxID=1295382 RepID=A0A8D5AJ29_9GAMM|nr:hypothetical protein MoryE10_09550 [Methylogaea oryzae]
MDWIGLPATLRLVEARGGAYVYVPKPGDLNADCALVGIVGHDAALLLAREFPGAELPVAKASAAMRAVRDAAICHDYYVLHKSQATLALAYRLDVRTIRNIVNRTALHDQLDMFGETA